MLTKSSSVAYIDFMTCAFAVFFALAAVQAPKKIEVEGGNATLKAEFAITLDWSDASRNDADLWLRGPEGVIFFRDASEGTMTLDRDDKGLGGPADPIRREVATIRSVKPGHYTVNVVWWTDRQGPENVKVSVLKLNPFRSVAEKMIRLETEGQESTVVSFDVDEHGRVTGVDSETQEPFATETKPS